MSLNRKEIIRKISVATSELLVEHGHISFVDLFQKLGYLSKHDYEKWRKGQVPYLEKVVQVNLKKISFIMKTVVKNSRNGKLKESWTSYKKWGKGPKQELIFTRRRNPYIEKTYSTHFLKPQVSELKEV